MRRDRLARNRRNRRCCAHRHTGVMVSGVVGPRRAAQSAAPSGNVNTSTPAFGMIVPSCARCSTKRSRRCSVVIGSHLDADVAGDARAAPCAGAAPHRGVARGADEPDDQAGRLDLRLPRDAPNVVAAYRAAFDALLRLDEALNHLAPAARACTSSSATESTSGGNPLRAVRRSTWRQNAMSAPLAQYLLPPRSPKWSRAPSSAIARSIFRKAGVDPTPTPCAISLGR